MSDHSFEQDDDSAYDGGMLEHGLDSPTDFDEHIMNEDDSTPPGDNNEEYYSDDLDGQPYGAHEWHDFEHDFQPDEAQEWHDFDPDC